MSGKPSWQKRLHEVRLNPTPKLKSNNDPTNEVTPPPAPVTPVPPAPAPAPKPDLTQADMHLLEEMLGRVHDPLIAEPPKASAPAQPTKPQPMSSAQSAAPQSKPVPVPSAPTTQKVVAPTAPTPPVAQSTAQPAKKAAPPNGKAKKPPTAPVEEAKEVEEAKPKRKSRVRKWAFLTIGLLVVIGVAIAGLLSLPDSRNFLFSFSKLTQREERYYNEVTQLNARAELQLNQAYQPLLNNSPMLQQQAYRTIYMSFGEVSAKFLALDAPSLRFDYPHTQLRKAYIRYEALSKQMLQTLEIDPKTIDRKLILEQLDDIRKLLEQGKADLRAAANL